MTTGNAPTIEEQISALRTGGIINRHAILASLEKLAALESQPVPVEPFRRFRGVLKPVDRGMWVNGPCDYYHDAEVDTRIDSLQSALKLAQEERDCALLVTGLAAKEQQGVLAVGQELIARKERAEKAEAERDMHYNRLAGLLFSGRLDALTGEDVRGFEKEYVDYKSINRRMVELLKEPSANMKSAGYGKPDYLAIFKAMSEQLLKEVEK